MSLFQLGDFKLASGTTSPWKIECDAFTPEDWKALARMAFDLLPPFSRVEGVPRGGLPFAEALREYCSPLSDRLLIAEDVVTTGNSIERFRDGREAMGVTVFVRGNLLPSWVVPLFTMTLPLSYLARKE